ncbi:ankyrin repeat domain protein [Nitzschia inconspicua]|uniref:Ankyrin repeat domain protein n=1 Tax=Nitzschia inconspicua TaxID=303405 RepID=A0A9K3KAJ4_9STRA|nr:ankyrin repeat domain protein [Nitzschia inconspicua]
MASFGLGGGGNGNTQATGTTTTSAAMDASTPYVAAAEGNLQLLQESLKDVSVTSLKDEQSYTLLQAAASYGQIEILQYLLSQLDRDNNTNTFSSSSMSYINTADKDGDTALHYAYTAETARLLVEQAHINIHAVNAEGRTALQDKQHELEVYLEEEEDLEDDDEEAEILRALIQYLSSLSSQSS